MTEDNQSGGAENKLSADVFELIDVLSARRAAFALERILSSVTRIAEDNNGIEAVRIRNLILHELTMIRPILSADEEYKEIIQTNLSVPMSEDKGGMGQYCR